MPAAAHVRQTPPHSPLASDTPSDVPETSTCVRGASPYLRSASPNVRGGSPSSPSNAAVVDYAAAATNDVLAHAKPGETIATTKEEEWVTRKKSEVTTTRQIATRVKREVTLEDGRVLSDSGPKVSTSTHEDTHTTNYHQSEHRALDPPSDEERGAGGTAIGADQVDGYHAASGTRVIQNGTAIGADGTAVATPVSTVVTSRVVANPEGKVRESHTKRQLTHHVTDHVREEQEEFHRGDTTHEAFITAVNETAEDDIREALNKRTSEQLALVPRGPRLVRETTAHSKTIDTEDTDELRALRPDGTILTETKRTTEHEHIQDEDLPADAAKSLSSNESIHRERSARERKACVETERATELMAGGRRLGTHVHSHTRTEEAEKEGDPNMEGPYDWDSLSMRMRRQRRLRHTEHDALKDSFAKRPIDFDIEEETRKKETSKWLENHFGSDSRSSHDSIAEEIGRKTDPGYFNVTIKSKPIADEGYYGKTNASTQPQPVFADRALRKTKSSTPSDERDITAKTGGYFKGVADWSQRRVEKPRMPEPRSVSPTLPVARSPYASTDRLNGASPKHVYSKRDSPQGGSSPPQGRRASRHPPSDSAYVSSSTVHSPPRGSPFHGESDRHREPSVEEDYRPPVAPERKRHSKPRLREDQRYDSGYRSSSRNETSGRSRDSEGASEPPPDYSPPPPRERRPSPEPSPQSRRRDERKQNQKTRFAAESARRRSPARKSVGAAIGNSIRKLVGKIRSASAERRARWRAAASRSPSPADHTSRTYQPYDDADLAPPPAPPAPPQRYYLGEDPFAGSIYGREHKYEGASPRRAANHDKRNGNDHRFSSTLGRFSHSTSRLNPNNEQEDYTRSAQTLPRKLQVKREKKDSTSSSDKRWHQLGPNKRSCSAVNVSVVNVAPTTNGKVTNGHHQGPAKPARTYKALNRSKSFAMGAPETEVQPRYVSGMNRNYSTMYKSNPHLSKLDETPEQLKSPGIVSIINRSQRDLADAVSREAERRRDGLFSTRYGKTPSYTNGNLNGRHDETDKKKLFMKGLKERAPELFQSLHGEDDSDGSRLSSRYNTPSPNYHNKDRISEERRIYKSDYSRDNSPYVTRFGSVEPVSRLRSPAPRRGSNSSDNYSETYRYSTKSGDPERPSVTDTVETVSKKVIPTRDGRGKEIIESREMNSVTTSRYKGEPLSNLKYVENGGRIPGFDRERISPSPLYSERRNSGYKVTEKVRDYRH